LNPNSSWHWGFGAAGVGMTLGIIQYLIGNRKLAAVGHKPERRAISSSVEPSERTDYLTVILAVVGGVLGAVLGIKFGDAGVVSALFPCVVGFFAGYLIGTTRLLNGDELRRVLVISYSFFFPFYSG
jgi:POT family proton-dependent oligopeptide transporter